MQHHSITIIEASVKVLIENILQLEKIKNILTTIMTTTMTVEGSDLDLTKNDLYKKLLKDMLILEISKQINEIREYSL